MSNAVLTTAEAMKRLRLSRSTVVRPIQEGRLQAYQKTPGKRSPYLIYVRSIEQLERARGEPEDDGRT